MNAVREQETGRMVERLGCPNPSKGSARSVEAIKNKADEFASHDAARDRCHSDLGL
jgi:hypothetical protein